MINIRKDFRVATTLYTTLASRNKDTRDKDNKKKSVIDYLP